MINKINIDDVLTNIDNVLTFDCDKNGNFIGEKPYKLRGFNYLPNLNKYILNDVGSVCIKKVFKRNIHTFKCISNTDYFGIFKNGKYVIPLDIDYIDEMYPFISGANFHITFPQGRDYECLGISNVSNYPKSYLMTIQYFMENKELFENSDEYHIIQHEYFLINDNYIFITEFTI